MPKQVAKKENLGKFSQLATGLLAMFGIQRILMYFVFRIGSVVERSEQLRVGDPGSGSGRVEVAGDITREPCLPKLSHTDIPWTCSRQTPRMTKVWINAVLPVAVMVWFPKISGDKRVMQWPPEICKWDL